MILEWEGCEIYAVQQTSFSAKISCRIQVGTGSYVVASFQARFTWYFTWCFPVYTGKNWLRYSTVCFRWWRIKQKKANPRTIQRNRIAPTTERATVASLLRTSIGDRFGLELVDTRKYSKTISLIASVKLHYCSFKIFPQFWLAKSTCIIHHNQLLMTKFGRILCLTKKGVIHLDLRPRWITHSSICLILHILRKPNSLIAK